MKDCSNLFTTLKRNPATAHAFIANIIRSPHNYGPWSLQGFGMLRLYLTSEIRLHVWDNRFANKDASIIHDHPWDFNSFVLTGQIINHRYKKTMRPDGDFKEAVIKCGPGGCLVSTNRCDLEKVRTETFGPGDDYIQLAEEIHSSHPDNGTITIVERQFKADTEHAHVYYPTWEQWGSAEPRRATDREIEAILASTNL